MKISNSKKQLAKIISENGGWLESAKFATQDKGDFRIGFWSWKEGPIREGDIWKGNGWLGTNNAISCDELLPNWHQTILSRDEYFHLYPAPDADGWIEWKSQFYGDMPCEEDAVVDVLCGTRTHSGYIAENFKHWGSVTAYRPHKPEQQKSTAVGDDETNLAAKEELEALAFEPAKPTIEQLAADYRAKLVIAQRAQEEADSHRCWAEAALEKLYQAGLQIGLDIAISGDKQEEPLNITDWRKLQIGDVIQCIGNWQGEETDGREFSVNEIEAPDYKWDLAARIEYDDEGGGAWGSNFKFIRRP